MAIFLAAQSVTAQVNIDLVPSIGPNSVNSPGSTATYISNALTGLTNNQSQAGAAGTPGHYAASTGNIPLSSIISTAGNSWLGNTSPQGAFKNEYGNNLCMGL